MIDGLSNCPKISSRFSFPSPNPLPLFLLRRAGEGTDGGTYFGTIAKMTLEICHLFVVAQPRHFWKRRRLMIRIVLLTATILVYGNGSMFAQEEHWTAGSAKINITPNKWMWMSGYASRDHPAEGKLSDLWGESTFAASCGRWRRVCCFHLI